ncbi:MAG: hypothetical protein MJ094_01120 [Saccharofermentans sp.]|nr:hypothetical protein [Saccharofermentans sp.]
MRKNLSVLIILAIACAALCGCGKSYDVEEFYSIYEDWYGARAEYLREAPFMEEPDGDSLKSEGVTDEGFDYEASYMEVDSQYREVRVLTETSSDTVAWYRIFDLNDDLLYVAVTSGTGDIDAYELIEANEYFIYGGSDAYLYDKDNDTYTSVDASMFPFQTFDEVMELYCIE